jgi:peptide/nickel transport system substrate-binding protein
MTTTTQRARWTGMAMVLALVAGGCGGGTKRDAGGDAETPQKGGTINIVGAYEPNSFNVKAKQTEANVNVMAGVWRGVWRMAPGSQFILDNDLMVSAEMTSTDPQTIVYKINPRAVWSDGVAVNADDFIYNWEASRPGATDVDGSPIQSVGAAGGDRIASVTGSDAGKTVTVLYKEPTVQWKGGLLFNTLVPAHVAKRVGWNTGFDRFDPDVVVSNGPFRIESYNPGRDITLIRNERYWGTPAYLDRIVFRFTAQDVAPTAFQNGEGDLVTGHAIPDAVAQLRTLPGVNTHFTPGRSQEYVGFNLRNELLAVPEVRRAFALALDRRSIVSRVVGAVAQADVVNSFLFANHHPEYRDTSSGRYDRPDVTAAKRLLEGAGFTLGGDGVYTKDGRRLSLRARTLNHAPHDAALLLVQAQVKAAGIELNIDNGATGVLGPQLQRGDFDVELLSYGKNEFGNVTQFRPGNKWGYSNVRPNQLIVQSGTELDDAKRLALLEQADRLLWDDLPIVPLYQSPELLAVRDAFVNVEPNTTGLGAFWNAERWARKGKA